MYRYMLRVTVTGKGMTPDTKKEFNFWVRNYELPSEAAAPIKVSAHRQLAVHCVCVITLLQQHVMAEHI